jgi:hypothetical protein
VTDRRRDNRRISFLYLHLPSAAIPGDPVARLSRFILGVKIALPEPFLPGRAAWQPDAQVSDAPR